MQSLALTLPNLKEVLLKQKCDTYNPRLLVSHAIKTIFPSDANVVVKQKRKRSGSLGMMKEMLNFNSSHSFNNSGDDEFSITIKNNTSKQDLTLDNKLQDFVNEVGRKSSFEETTIINTPHGIKKEFNFNNSETFENMEFMKLLKDSSENVISKKKGVQRIHKDQIVYDPKVFDIYEPEFSSEDEAVGSLNSNSVNKIKQLDSSNKTLVVAKNKSKYMNDKYDPNQVKSVYLDDGKDDKIEQFRNEDQFALYSTKLGKIANTKSNNSIQHKKNMNFNKKASIYDSLKEQFKLNIPSTLERNPSLRAKMSNNKEVSKASIDKQIQKTPAFGKKNSIQQFKFGTNEVFAVYKNEHNSVSKNKEVVKNHGTSVSSIGHKQSGQKQTESPQFGKFLFGSKRKDLHVYLK